MKHLFSLSLFISTLMVICEQPFADDENEKKLSELKQSISNLQKDLEKSNKEKNQLENDLMSIELRVSQLNTDLRGLSKKIGSLEAEQKNLDKRRFDLQTGIERQRNALTQHFLAAFKMGSQEPIKLLLNQRDPSKFARVVSYYNYFSESRTEQIKTFEHDLNRLEEIFEEIAQQKADLANSRESLARNHQELLLGKDQRQQTLDKIELSLESDHKKLRQWEKQRSRLQAILNSVQTSATDVILSNDYSPISSRKGRLSWPVIGRVVKRFGNIRSGSLRWEGWLINTRSGTPVNSVHQGRVVFSNYLRGFGLLIIVDHGDSFMTLYAHNQELLKDTGDWVETDDILAHSGDSGGLDKPALYFEIRKQGAPINPKSWLVKR